MGFLSDQTKPSKVEGQNKKIIEDKVKSEVDKKVEDLQEGFYKFIKHQLKECEFIGLEHIQKGFNQAVTQLGEEIDEHNDKIRDKK